MTADDTTNEGGGPSHFIHEIVEEDNKTGKFDGRVHTRFPPEPNGFLHIGHAKSIVLNFELAKRYGGKTNLRFDDTNPAKEEQEYIDAIIEDIKWLGYQWDGDVLFASDYFSQLYEWAVELIQQGKAYVDQLSQEEMREYRGTLTKPGKNSPYRDRSAAENLELFEKMKNGEFGEGEAVLRAKIDMASPNINLRDPVMYRVLNASHPRTGDKWHIYPMYDWAHGQSDSIEGITHSICTLEYAAHRPLYDWYLNHIEIYHPQQIEFARLNMTYTVMSKRKLRRLVEEGHVSGWDDPRMPTISAMRRRGYSPQSLRDFAEGIGVAKSQNMVEIQNLEYYVRQDLNKTSPRVMAVLDPLKVVIENYPDGQSEDMELANNPEDESAGTRKVPFSKTIYIERADFMEDPPRKFHRLSPGKEVRLRNAYLITCTDVIKDADGNVTELRASYDPATKGGNAPDGRRVKGTLHWVSADHALTCEVREYDRLFLNENPDDAPDEGDFTDNLNPDSLTVLPACYVEPSVKGAKPFTRYQFERIGYFVVDPDSTDEKPVFNKTVGLRDQWAKLQKKGKTG